VHRKKINISIVLAGQKHGIKEVDEGIWRVSFMHYDLGYFDLEQTLQPLDNTSGRGCHPRLRYVFVTHVSGLDIPMSRAAHCQDSLFSNTAILKCRRQHSVEPRRRS
jgi:hypothetical protein